MNVTRAHLGGDTYASASKRDGVIVYMKSEHYYLDDTVQKLPPDTWVYGEPATDRGPFDVADFGDRDRLSWPVAGCAIPLEQKLVFWAHRYVAWLEYNGPIAIVDATRPIVLRLRWTGLDGRRLLVQGGKLWISTSHGIVNVELAALAALFERAPGPLDVHVRETYPARTPVREKRGRVTRLDGNRATVTMIDVVHKVEVPVVRGLAVDTVVTLRDELWPDLFMAIELPDATTHALYAEPDTEETVTVQLEHEPAVDPAGRRELAPLAGDAAPRRDLAELFRALADAPDDDASRMVIVDALEDAGEPYAPLLAELVAGDVALTRRRDALGTLASYLDDIEYRGGLPWSARLAKAAPLDEAIGDAVAADLRLGLLHTLRIGDGPFNVYAKLVGSPRAVGLRHVDAPNARVLAALIAGGRRELVRLSSVKFVTREVIAALADPTFDRALELETETRAPLFAKQLEFIIRDEAKLFARVPRHLIFVERDRRDEQLVEPVLAAWDRLPLAAVTVGGATLYRDGTAHVLDTATPETLGAVRRRFSVERRT